LKTLYISYFGALKPLSHSQVIPYLCGLAHQGIGVTLMSFEEALHDPEEEARRRAALASELQRQGIHWVPLRYHKRPSFPATAFDVAVGVVVAAYLVLRHRMDVIHARNHIPALIGLIVRALVRCKLVFDLRGVMAEEYAEAGVWKTGSLPFRAIKWVERRALASADAIVMLTHRIHEALRQTSVGLSSNRAPVEIIPSCVDTDRYRGIDRSAARSLLGFGDDTVLAYAGSLGGWYMSSEMVDFLIVARQRLPRVHFMVLTQSSFDLIERELRTRGVGRDRYSLRTVDPASMAMHLAAADVGLSFIRAGYSKWSSSPTKIGEYLASGLPVVTSAGIGDVDEMVQSDGVGITIDAFTSSAYLAAAERLADLLGEGPSLRERCRRTADRRLSLERVGWPGYRRVYQSLEAGRR